MTRIYLTLLGALLMVVTVSCEKQGCMDCNAINYESEAEKDDNSCQYVNEQYVGVYAVHDSVSGPPSMEWYHDSYNLIISKTPCAPEAVVLSNYANKNNTHSGTLFSVHAQVENGVISIVEQDVRGDVVRRSLGYFVNDSIYLDIEYENEFGEVFYGQCFGVKQ